MRGRALLPLASSALGNAHYSTAAASLALSEAKTGGGFFSKLFGGGDRLSVPLTEPLPTIDIQKAAVPSTKPSTHISTLPNGVRIASEAVVGPTVSLGVYVDAGSVYELPGNAGVSHLLEYMAFKATTNRTHFRLVREVEAIGATVLASASREQMAYVIDAANVHLPEALEILTDAVLNPAFLPWEVKNALTKMEGDLQNLKDNPQTTMLEALHSCAYMGALGRPLVCPSDHISLLNPDELRTFHSGLFTAPRIVLSGAGMEHDALVSLAKPLLESVGSGVSVPEPQSTYVGGDWRQYSPTPLTHAVLAFEFAGGWKDVKGATIVTVLQYLLGGGGSFSAGGPGKGMHSRLYTRVLNKHHWVHNCTAINSMYNNTGLVGIFASAESSHVDQLLGIMTDELLAVAKSVTDEELARAKNATVSAVLMNMESRAVIAEDIGRQVLTYGERKPESQFLDIINSLKPSDITSFVTKLLKTPLSMAVLGDAVSAPRYDDVAKRFK